MRPVLAPAQVLFVLELFLLPLPRPFGLYSQRLGGRAVLRRVGGGQLLHQGLGEADVRHGAHGAAGAAQRPAQCVLVRRDRQAQAAAADDYFTAFITSSTSPVIFALLFMGVTAFIVYNGVEKGIEKVSKWMMPVLLVLVVVIAVYSLTISHTDASGQLRTGLQGFLYYLKD